MKASIMKRIVGYLIDVIILFLLMSIISPIIPTFGDADKLQDRTLTLSEELLDNKITSEEFMKEAENINYDISKSAYLTDIASICIYLGYFVIMPLLTGGQTLGKKLMKLKIKKVDDAPLTINSLLIRAVVLYGIANSIINLVLLLTVSKTSYLQISGYVNIVFSIVIIATFFMMLTRKDGRGIPDLLANTEVVTVEEKELIQ